MNASRLILIFLLLCKASGLSAQENSNLRSYHVEVTADTLILDSLSIAPSSLYIISKGKVLANSNYEVDPVRATLVWITPPQVDSVRINYRVFPVNFSDAIQFRDTSIITPASGEFDPFVIGKSNTGRGGYTSDGLNKSGSISRGVSFGNSQNLAVNSSLDLQLSGKISDRVNILAAITDANIPIQPDGNTQQLQDFDQVYIQLFNEKFTLVGGDFQLRKPTGYFMKYHKRAQGATLQLHDLGMIKAPGQTQTLRASAAVSKGKFSRNTVQGIEGNQGPYRLRGAENELFIIVLAGTERVFIDGRLLERGKEFDYTIDYNSAEIVFTPSQPITKDKRIIVEFQYSDKNYARSLLEASFEAKAENYSWYINAYGEQDSKNQPLQQDLDLNDKIILSDAGDNLLDAFVNGADSVGYSDNQVLYALVDSLGYDSVYVFSSNPDSAFYRVRFSTVGLGNGDYVESDFIASGRVFEWIAPDTIDDVLVHKGTHIPQILLVAPRKNQMVSAGVAIDLGREYKIEIEGALSNRDLNTFSDSDNGDNVGTAARVKVMRQLKTGTDSSWQFAPGLYAERTDNPFRTVERFRSAEFERDWNLSQSADETGVELVELGLGWQHKTKGRLGVDGAVLFTDDAGRSWRLGTDSQWQNGRTKAKVKGYWQETGLPITRFIRHKAGLQHDLGWVVVGVNDEHEWNEFRLEGDTLLPSSYRFYDWEAFIASPDTFKNKFRIFYKERSDQAADSNALALAARAQQYGASLDLLSNTKQQIRLKGSSRVLRIVDSELINQEPENSLVGRVEYNLNAAKGFLQLQTFYETGTGLEQAREFIYLEVPAGQGIYVWNDYNEDGVKDLDEFEIAQFDYDANYIRTFIQTNEYVRTFARQFSQTLNLNPARLKKSEKAAVRFLQRYSNITSFRIDQKTTEQEGGFSFLDTQVSDSNLITLNSSWRSTLFFNRSQPIFGMDATYQDTRNKALLTSGFDSRELVSIETHLRWNFVSSVTFEARYYQAEKSALSDFLGNRNFEIAQSWFEPSLSWQPNTEFRLKVKARYGWKENSIDYGGQSSTSFDSGLEARYSKLAQGVLSAAVNVIQVNYDGLSGGAVTFEMLEGLQPGMNATWNATVQKKISENLQINLIYNGRKSEDSKSIHNGGAQVRAFF